MTLKKSFVIPAVCVGVFYLGSLAFLILSRPLTAAPLLEAVIMYPIGVIGLPVVGSLLIVWGFKLLHSGGLVGLIPSPIAGLAVIPAGLALSFAFPLVIFNDNEVLSTPIIVRGVFALLLVLPFVVVTTLLHVDEVRRKLIQWFFDS